MVQDPALHQEVLHATDHEGLADGGAPPTGPSDPNSPMPWTMYAGMTEEDLGAIHDYLHTVPPVVHRVDKWPEAGEVGTAAAR